MRKQKQNAWALLSFYLLILVGGFIGWVLNIVNLFKTENFEFTGVVILQIVGIFVAPLGAILGYLV